MKYLIIKHLNMKKLMIILSALALTFGAYSCTKTPEPNAPDKTDETSKDPSQEPVVSDDPSESPDDKLSITEIYPIGEALSWGWNISGMEAMTGNGGVFTWEGELKANVEFKFLLQKQDNVWWPGLVRDVTSDDPYAIIVGTDDSMDNKFRVDVHGIYLITIDAKDSEALSMKVELKEEIKDEKIEITELYLLGSSTAWGWSLDAMEAFSTSGDGIFTWSGKLTAEGELRFPLQKQSNVWWPCLVKGAEDGTLAVGYSDADKNNIDVPADGYYLITVNANEMTYTMEPFELPAIQVKPLFGFQATQADPHGMILNANYTLAVVGDYLVLSNALDYTKMPVYNRFTGEFLGDDFVDTSNFEAEGIDGTMHFMAIANDDADHLVAATFVDTRDGSGENGTVRVFTWNDGIGSAPASKEWAGFYNWGAGAAWAFSNLKVAGDVTKNAVLGTSSTSGKAVFATIRDGKSVSTRFISDIHEGSAWWSSNVIPTDGEATGADNVKFMSVSGNFRQYLSYAPGAVFDLSENYWYMGGGQYQRNAIGGDWIQAAGRNLFGVLNGWYAGSADSFGNNQFYYQLVVSDITAAPTASSLTDGLIFASRSSANEKGLEGMGYGEQGMFSPFAYESGQTVLGPNAVAANKNQIGDVAFASTGSNKVQVYAVVMNLGLVGYEITFNE